MCNALEMNATFAQTPQVHCDLSDWDVLQVITIERMFESSAFSQDISG